MTSWANNNRMPLKKKEPSIRSFFSSPSDDYAVVTLGFLYGFIYSQRSAEPYYIQDKQGYIQPLLKTSPILHYIKDAPSSAINMAMDPEMFAPVLNTMSLATMKRTITSILQYNGETTYKIDEFLNNYGAMRQSYDAGIVLDISGCVPAVISGLKSYQKRTGKKTMRIFVMTDNMNLLREFATTGDPSWNYVSLMRVNAPTTKEYTLTKTLAEIKVLQQMEFLAIRMSSALGRLLFLTNEKIQSESQIFAVDNQRWKAI